MSQAVPPSSPHDGAALASIPAFSCAYSNSGQGIAEVRPTGELDVATAPQLEHALEAALRSAPVVVLDLSGLAFVDSSGVHAIAAATLAARTAGRRLITLRGPAHIHDVFALTDSESDIDIVEAEDSPLATSL